MRNWIAGAMTVLGTLLVLGGAVTIILRAWWKPLAGGEAAPPPAPAPAGAGLFGGTAPPQPPARASGLFGRLDAPERLIAWGIVLLVLAAVAAGAIGFNLGASTPVH